MLLTENNNGYVKGIYMFNEKQSRVWTTKEETDSPTSANETIVITAEIDDKEGRDVMEVDVPNTFIKKTPHKEKGDIVMMKITGELVDMLLKLDTEKFKGYVVYETVQEVIYVVALREIYIILVVLLLLYQKFKKYLKSIIFVFNNSFSLS